MADLPDDHVSWENLIYVADFLAASGERSLGLLGGEPLEHPDFVDFLLYLLDRGFNVTVFTSGITSPGQQDALRAAAPRLDGLPPERLTFVCNLNDPAADPGPPAQARALDAFLALAGPWTLPGFNVYRPDFDLAFVVELINRHGLRRHLRLGAAHPLPGAEGPFLAPDDMPRVAERLFAHRALLERWRVKPGLDCGFPMCAFTDAQLGWLTRLSGPVRFGCGPAVDIAPDMRVFPCFPLADLEPRSLFDFDDLAGLVAHQAKAVAAVRSELAGVFPACDSCHARTEGLCAGGGACHLMDRMVGEEPVRLASIARALERARRAD